MIYDYHCTKCEETFEVMHVKYEERDDERFHDCGELVTRVPHKVTLGDEPYQMKAVLANGEKVKGHFGKSAKRDKKGARK